MTAKVTQVINNGTNR